MATFRPHARLAAECSICSLLQRFGLQRRLLKVLTHPLPWVCCPGVARKLPRAWLEVLLTSTKLCRSHPELMAACLPADPCASADDAAGAGGGQVRGGGAAVHGGGTHSRRCCREGRGPG